jgi:hypothetical protein
MRHEYSWLRGGSRCWGISAKSFWSSIKKANGDGSHWPCRQVITREVTMKSNVKLAVAIFVLSISAIRLLVIALVASCATLLNSAAAEPLIATEQGRIRGIEMPSVRKFLGNRMRLRRWGICGGSRPNLPRTGPGFSMLRNLAAIARRLPT